MDGKQTSQNLQGFGELKYIPLVVRYAAGAPSIVQNPTGEVITLTDTGTGDLLLTLGTAGACPLIVQALVLPAAAGTLMLDVNLKTAPTSSVVALLVSAADAGTVDTDPVDLHILIIKQLQS